MTTSNETLQLFSDDLARAVELAEKSLVAVHGRRRHPSSGVLWTEELILTADHTIEREEEIRITLAQGQKISATLLARDPGSDLALLRLKNPTANKVTLAPENSLRVGNFVLALGRPGTNSPMASFGIVSAIGGTWRTARGGMIEGYIRADVSLYPGFSGGPLVDVQGRLVGLNSTRLAGGYHAALPVSFLSNVVNDLCSKGRVSRAYLGITSQPVQIPSTLADKLGLAQESGLVVLRVEPESPSEQAKLLIGDVVIAFEGKSITDGEELQKTLKPSLVDQEVIITVIRGGESKELTITPRERT